MAVIEMHGHVAVYRLHDDEFEQFIVAFPAFRAMLSHLIDG